MAIATMTYYNREQEFAMAQVSKSYNSQEHRKTLELSKIIVDADDASVAKQPDVVT